MKDPYVGRLVPHQLELELLAMWKACCALVAGCHHQTSYLAALQLQVALDGLPDLWPSRTRGGKALATLNTALAPTHGKSTMDTFVG